MYSLCEPSGQFGLYNPSFYQSTERCHPSGSVFVHFLGTSPFQSPRTNQRFGFCHRLIFPVLAFYVYRIIIWHATLNVSVFLISIAKVSVLFLLPLFFVLFLGEQGELVLTALYQFYQSFRRNSIQLLDTWSLYFSILLPSMLISFLLLSLH